jgi:hypothetical protein
MILKEAGEQYHRREKEEAALSDQSWQSMKESSL